MSPLSTEPDTIKSDSLVIDKDSVKSQCGPLVRRFVAFAKVSQILMAFSKDAETSKRLSLLIITLFSEDGNSRRASCAWDCRFQTLAVLSSDAEMM